MIDGYVSFNGVLQFNDVIWFIVDGFYQLVVNQLVFQYVVGGYGGYVEIFIFNINGMVEEENWDFGFFCFFQYWFLVGGYYWCNEDCVDFLSNKGMYCFDLVFLFLLIISDFQGDIVFGGFFFCDVGFCCMLVGFRIDL